MASGWFTSSSVVSQRPETAFPIHFCRLACDEEDIALLRDQLLRRDDHRGGGVPAVFD
jgi:hypothetical protein